MPRLSQTRIVIALVGALLFVSASCSNPSGSEDQASPTTEEAETDFEQDVVVRDDWGTLFDDADVTGTFALREVGSSTTMVWNADRASEPRIPASTFKVFNSLVILETGVLPDTETVVPWDGIERNVAAWNQDHSLRTGIEASAVWMYQDLSRQVGEEQMLALVNRAGYGNADIGGGIDEFWLSGDLRITPLEQLDFLENLANRELPFRPEVMAAVADILVREQGDGWTWSHKTGTARTDGPDLGWLVGIAEYDGRTFVFAMNLDLESATNAGTPLDPQVRQNLAREILTSEDALPESGYDYIEADVSWQSTASEDELVAFAGIDGRSVVVGSADGRVLGSADFDAQVQVEAFPAVDRVAVRDADGSTVWTLDTSTGQVVEEFNGLGDPGSISSKDGVYSAEVVDGDIDGEGSVTIRETQTGTQRFYTSAEPGWVFAGDGVAFARSSDLAAIPTSSTSSSDTQALMVASAATGDLVAFTGPESHSFMDWIGPSCWLSHSLGTLLVRCVNDTSIESIMELDAEAMFGTAPTEIDPQHASISGPELLALSLPPVTGDGGRRLVVGSPTAGLVEVQTGSFPRWSPSGRFLAATDTDVLLILAPDGSVMTSYDEVSGRAVWTASGRS